MNNLKVGDRAPEINANDQDGNPVSLNQFKGHKLVLYFYPKDNTSGCTDEACNLRDNYEVFIEKGFKILGVSADNEKSHQNFIKKNKLPFPLIADVDKKVIRDYGVWGPKKLYGRTYDGILRTTFLISEEGVIEEIIRKVDTKNHSTQIFEVLNS